MGEDVDPAWITAALALLAAVFTCFITLGRVIWRICKGLLQFLGDLNGTPARPGVPAVPGVMERLSSVERQLTAVAVETKPNGGTSMRDIVHQTAVDVAEMKAAMHRINGKVNTNTESLNHLSKRVEQFEAERQKREINEETEVTK